MKTKTRKVTIKRNGIDLFWISKRIWTRLCFTNEKGLLEDSKTTRKVLQWLKTFRRPFYLKYLTKIFIFRVRLFPRVDGHSNLLKARSEDITVR